jgi:hypothetical protein
MLSYAIRRGVEYYDTAAIKQIVAELESNEYRSTALVSAIVKSLPFQYRRPENAPGDQKP